MAGPNKKARNSPDQTTTEESPISVSSSSDNSSSQRDDSTSLSSIDDHRNAQDDSSMSEESDSKSGSPLVLPAKRGRPKGSRKTSSPEPPAIKTITFSFTIYKKLDRSNKKKHAMYSDFFKARSTINFEDFQAELVKAVEEVKGSDTGEHSEAYSDYIIEYSRTRFVPKPVVLRDQNKFDHMIESSMKGKEATMSLDLYSQADEVATVEPEVPKMGKEKDMKTKSGTRKTKVPSEKQILPCNRKVDEKIGELRETFACGQRGCGSNHCFRDLEAEKRGEKPPHFPLTNRRLDSWASAWLADENTANLFKPPNNADFATLDATLKGESTVLQQRISELKKTDKSIPQGNPIVVNFPANLFGFPLPSATTSHSGPASTSDSAQNVIPPNFEPGIEMLIDDFCIRYCPQNPNILELLRAENFADTRAFRRMTVGDLVEMKFKKGDKSAFLDAVEAWALPKNWG